MTQRTPVVRALLIQSVVELRDCLQPYLEPLVAQCVFAGAEYDSALQWILAEELELIYGLFDRRHEPVRRDPPYHQIYCQLRNSLPMDLSRYVSHYVAAPRIYYEQNWIDLELRGPDLHLFYYRNPYDPPVISNYPTSRR